MKVFVYGTLRDGGALQSMLRGERHPAWAWGFALFEYGSGAYPVMMEAPGQPVVGEVVDVADPEAFADVALMEAGAGYEARMIRVRVAYDRVDGSGLKDVCDEDAVAFVFPDPDDDGIGAHVESGDWITHVGMRRLRDA